MAPIAEDGEFDAADYSYQTCYVFRPTSNPAHDIDPRPRKKRKTTERAAEQPTENETPWPSLCKGEESDRSAKLRQNAYAQHWQAAEARIAAVAVDDVDEPTVDKIRTYIQTSDGSTQELCTAIVVAGSNKSAFGHCLTRLRGTDKEELVVPLPASQVPSLQVGLKALIRNTIETHSSLQSYDSFVARNKMQIPMNFDLELLQKYVEANDIPRIVIAMPDAETFDLKVFSELITNLMSWKGRLPFVLVLGLATTVHLFESRLSKATMRRLDAEVFTLNSDRDVCFDILEAVQTKPADGDAYDPGPGLVLGPSLISSLAAFAENQSTTIHSFKKAIQYAYMMHFYSNPLSTLLNSEAFNGTDIDSTLCEAIRNTTSFQAYCTAIIDGIVSDADAPTVRELLFSDKALFAYTQQQLSSSHTDISTSHGLFLSLARLAAELQPKIPPFKLYHDLLTSHLHDTLLDSDAYDIISTTLPTLSNTALNALLPKLSPLLTSTSTTLTPPTLLNHIDQQLTALSPSILAPFPSEALLLTSRGPLFSAFNPKPRFAIERALSSPADYLGCECCTSMYTTEPSAVLYRLLGDAGREINLMDLWTTFRDRVLPEDAGASGRTKGKGKEKSKEKSGEKDKTPAKGKRKSKATNAAEDDEPAHDDSNAHDAADINGGASPEEADPERLALAHFHTALAELKYLGLVKSTSDRRLNKGVEVISRTTWHGL